MAARVLLEPVEQRTERASGRLALGQAMINAMQERLEEIEQLKAEIIVSNKLLAERNRILESLPCPEHGLCVPYVLEEIKRLKVEVQTWEGNCSFHGQRWVEAVEEIERLRAELAAKQELGRDDAREIICATMEAREKALVDILKLVRKEQLRHSYMCNLLTHGECNCIMASVAALLKEYE